jgi:hypothetical protein
MSNDVTPNVDFGALKRRSRLPAPPTEASDNLTAPEVAPAVSQPSMLASSQITEEGVLPPGRPRGRVVTPYVEPPAMQVIDGRARLRTGRTEPFSTRVRAEFRPLLVHLADHLNCTMAEALERAVEEMAKRNGVT